jgi:hypothetical protein
VVPYRIILITMVVSLPNRALRLRFGLETAMSDSTTLAASHQSSHGAAAVERPRSPMDTLTKKPMRTSLRATLPFGALSFHDADIERKWQRCAAAPSRPDP